MRVAEGGGPSGPSSTPTESLEENMRFSHNLHELELNLNLLEQTGEPLPERSHRRSSRHTAARSPFSSPFSSPLGATSAAVSGTLTSPTLHSTIPTTPPRQTPLSLSRRTPHASPIASPQPCASSPLSESSNLSGGVSTRRKRSVAIYPPTPPHNATPPRPAPPIPSMDPSLDYHVSAITEQK